jgi:hypothetical protein
VLLVALLVLHFHQSTLTASFPSVTTGNGIELNKADFIFSSFSI